MRFILFLMCLPLSCFSLDHFVIAITGGSGSGKTTMSENIKQIFEEDAVIIAQDSYYKDLSHLPKEERAKTNFDHPDSIDFLLLRDHLLRLKSDQVIEKPIYDFRIHTRIPKKTIVEPKKVIIVEGILLLAIEELRDLFDLKIFMDTDEDVRLLRRLERDINERGRDFEGIKRQYLATVKPMYFKYVHPSKKYADIIIPRGGKNTQAIHMVTARLKEEVALRETPIF